MTILKSKSIGLNSTKVVFLCKRKCGSVAREANKKAKKLGDNNVASAIKSSWKGALNGWAIIVEIRSRLSLVSWLIMAHCHAPKWHRCMCACCNVCSVSHFVIGRDVSALYKIQRPVNPRHSTPTAYATFFLIQSATRWANTWDRLHSNQFPKILSVKHLKKFFFSNKV